MNLPNVHCTEPCRPDPVPQGQTMGFRKPHRPLHAILRGSPSLRGPAPQGPGAGFRKPHRPLLRGLPSPPGHSCP